MKQKKAKNEEADLLSSWVMERANRMTTEYGVPQDEACRKAHLAKHLVELMGQGVVEFQYRKLERPVAAGSRNVVPRMLAGVRRSIAPNG